MTAYYNEHDPKAAAWLRELIKAGAIAPGDVDERSIVDVSASDVRGYTQCHWFAGIGVWSYSLRQAGWGDDQRVWTASLPCQPFSAAGKQLGFEDERHLWPVFEQLVAESDVAIAFGEQVASKAVNDWLDVVSVDMEALGFAFGAIAFPAAGVGAPHIRDRTYWVAAKPGALADAAIERRFGRWTGEAGDGRDTARIESERLRHAGGLADAGSERIRAEGLGAAAGASDGMCGEARERERIRADTGTGSAVAGGLADADGRHTGTEGLQRSGQYGQQPQDGGPGGWLADADHAGLERRVGVLERTAELVAGAVGLADSTSAGGPLNGFWRDADWLLCRDGKWRPVMPIHVQVASRSAPDMGRVRAGNAAQGKEKEVNHDSVQTLQHRVGEKALGKKSGSADSVLETGVLRPGVYGEGDGEGSLLQREPLAQKGEQIPETGMRGMRVDGKAPSTPQGREPAQQRSAELEDALRYMSSSCSLAELHGDRRTAEALRVLREAIYEEGMVLHSLESVQEVWASLGEEAKNRVRVGFDASRWKVVAPVPLTKGARARVARLRGYGNAVCSEAAKVWIETCLEVGAEV